jgi:hypothetical protein
MNFDLARSLRKILALAQRSRLDRELAEEIETHRVLLEQRGGSENAGKLMGNITLAREESRDMWTFRQLQWIFQDARHAPEACAAAQHSRPSQSHRWRLALEPTPPYFPS